MSAYEMARDWSVAILTYIGASAWASFLAHILPARILENGFFKSTTVTKIATGVRHNTTVHATPYAWARGFLEESGFNVTGRIPALFGVYEIPGFHYQQHLFARRVVAAVPPYLLHELSLHWTFLLIGNLFQSLANIDPADLGWFLVLVLIMASVYHWRRPVNFLLSGFWTALNEDVEAFVVQHFFTEHPPDIYDRAAAKMKKVIKTALTRQQVKPVLHQLPADAITISAADMENLTNSADAMQKRINNLRMSKLNFLRGRRTGVFFNPSTFRKLRAEVTRAQDALKKERAANAKRMFKVFGKLQKQNAGVREALDEEKAAHGRTQRFLDQEIGARAELEEQHAGVRGALDEEKAAHQRTQRRLDQEIGARAEAEEQLEKLRASLQEQPRQTADEDKGESPAGQRDFHPESKADTRDSSSQTEDVEKADEESTDKVIDSQPAVTQNSGLPVHTPASKTAGPEGAKNTHIQKLNAAIKKLEWMRKSGKPDLVEDRGGVAAPDDVLGKQAFSLPPQSSRILADLVPDGMYDRQVTQFLNSSPIHYPRGGMWGALNNVSNPIGKTDQQNDDTPMLGPYKVTRGPPPSEDSKKAVPGSDKGVPTKVPATSGSGTPKAEEDGSDQDRTDDGDGKEQKNDDGKKEEEGKEKKGNEEDKKDTTEKQESVTPPSVPQSQPPTSTQSPPSAPSTTDASPPTPQGATNDGPGHETPSHDPKSTAQRPANYFPAAVYAKKTHDEEVADVFTDFVQQRGTAKLEDSIWAPKSGAKAPASPPQVPSKRTTQRPSNYFPAAVYAKKTHDEEVADVFTDFVQQRGTAKLEDSIWAPKSGAKAPAMPQQAPSHPAKDGPPSQPPSPPEKVKATRAPPRGPPDFSKLPNPQPPPGAPTGPRALTPPNPGPRRPASGYQTSSSAEPYQSGAHKRQPSPPKASQAPPTQGRRPDEPKYQAPPLNPRPSEPPFRGSPLRNEIVPSPPQSNVGGTLSRTVPSPTAPFTNGQSPYSTTAPAATHGPGSQPSRQQQQQRVPAPAMPPAAPAGYNNTPTPSSRGGRGGRGGGRGGSGAESGASSSFKRFQEGLAKEAEKKKKEEEGGN